MILAETVAAASSVGPFYVIAAIIAAGAALAGGLLVARRETQNWLRTERLRVYSELITQTTSAAWSDDEPIGRLADVIAQVDLIGPAEVAKRAHDVQDAVIALVKFESNREGDELEYERKAYKSYEIELHRTLTNTKRRSSAKPATCLPTPSGAQSQGWSASLAATPAETIRSRERCTMHP